MALVIEKLKRVISSFSTSRSSVKSNFTSDSLLLRQQRTFQQVESLNGEFMFQILHLLPLFYHIPVFTCVDPDLCWEYGSKKLLNAGPIRIFSIGTGAEKNPAAI